MFLNNYYVFTVPANFKIEWFAQEICKNDFL